MTDKISDSPSGAQLMRFILGKWISKPIAVAAELGIADRLTDGPRSIDQLARDTATHAPSLYRLLRALASVGIFSEIDERIFTLSPLAEGLLTGALRSTAMMIHAEWNDRAWLRLGESVRTGKTAFEKEYGRSLAEWLPANPDAQGLLVSANAAKAARSQRALVETYDFAGIAKLVDLAGGKGAMLAGILEAHPGMQGILAELPSVIPEAERLIRSRGLSERCQTTACDFFEQAPPKGDALLLSHVLHDWSDENCRRILDHCAQSLQQGEKLLILEMLIPPGNQSSMAKLLDLEMLVITGGRERTESEYRDLLKEKFSVVGNYPVGELALLEAVRV